MLRNNKKRRKRRLSKNEGHILRALASYSSPSLSSLELETRVFMTGSSLESSRTSSDPLSKDKSASGPRVVEMGIEDGVTTKKEPSFIAWKGALNLGCSYGSNFLLRSGALSRNRSRLTTNISLSLGTLLSRNRLKWRD